MIPGERGNDGRLPESELLQFLEDEVVPAKLQALSKGLDRQDLVAGCKINAPEVEVVDELLRFLL